MGLDFMYGPSTTLTMRDFFRAWYQPDVSMEQEDWIYIGCLIAGANLSFGIGLLIGMVWARFI